MENPKTKYRGDEDDDMSRPCRRQKVDAFTTEHHRFLGRIRKGACHVIRKREELVQQNFYEDSHCWVDELRRHSAYLILIKGEVCLSNPVELASVEQRKGFPKPSFELMKVLVLIQGEDRRLRTEKGYSNNRSQEQSRRTIQRPGVGLGRKLTATAVRGSGGRMGTTSNTPLTRTLRRYRNMRTTAPALIDNIGQGRQIGSTREETSKREGQQRSGGMKTHLEIRMTHLYVVEPLSIEINAAGLHLPHVYIDGRSILQIYCTNIASIDCALKLKVSWNPATTSLTASPGRKIWQHRATTINEQGISAICLVPPRPSGVKIPRRRGIVTITTPQHRLKNATQTQLEIRQDTHPVGNEKSGQLRAALGHSGGERMVAGGCAWTSMALTSMSTRLLSTTRDRLESGVLMRDTPSVLSLVAYKGLSPKSKWPLMTKIKDSFLLKVKVYFCYTMMPFWIKNAGLASLQVLEIRVRRASGTQPDVQLMMVIKEPHRRRVGASDIVETFRALRKINMKLYS
ncbi:hypothetical protein Tco_1016069 [Tanacetum coccineum]|uniref:Uncharacterized protein n=1 Tax=Tanacetum coccineum TaxID=301880 RepID=A0ABQ5FN22_9ASTR